jgi:predicted PurR-regulated permease PerM
MAGELGTSRIITWREVVLFLLTLGLLALCGRILLPFASALTWAVALAVATRPAYLWLDRRLGRPGVSSAIAVVLVLVLIVVPVTILAQHVVRELLRVARLVQTGAVEDWAVAMAGRHRWADRLLDRATEWRGNRTGTQVAAGYVAHRTRGVLLSSVRIVTELAMMLFALFFLYRDGDRARTTLISVLPMKDEDAEFVVGRMAAVIAATMEGRLVIAMVQGAMGGVMFFSLGVPHPVIWGLMMAATGMIPMVGTMLVWGPAAGYLALMDHPVKAVVLVVWGGGVVGMVDNLLYPQLVGSRLQMHTLATFFAILGGVAAFGVSGLVLGPLVMVTAVELVRLWKPSAPVVGRGAA